MRPAWTSCIPATKRRRRRTPPADAAASRPPTGNLLPAGRPRRTTARRTRASRQGRPRRRLPRSTRLPGAQAACSASRFAVMPKRRDTGKARVTRGRSWEAARQRSLGRYSQSARRAGRPGTFDVPCAGREPTTGKSVDQAGKWTYLVLRSTYDEWRHSLHPSERSVSPDAIPLSPERLNPRASNFDRSRIGPLPLPSQPSLWTGTSLDAGSVSRSHAAAPRGSSSPIVPLEDERAGRALAPGEAAARPLLDRAPIERQHGLSDLELRLHAALAPRLRHR